MQLRMHVVYVTAMAHFSFDTDTDDRKRSPAKGMRIKLKRSVVHNESIIHIKPHRIYHVDKDGDVLSRLPYTP